MSNRDLGKDNTIAVGLGGCSMQENHCALVWFRWSCNCSHQLLSSEDASSHLNTIYSWVQTRHIAVFEEVPTNMHMEIKTYRCSTFLDFWPEHPNCVERQVTSECIWVLVGKIVQDYSEVLKRWTPKVTDQNPQAKHTCFSDKPAKVSSSHIWAIVPSLALNWLSMQHTKFDKMWGTLFWVGTQGCSQELKEKQRPKPCGRNNGD
jgi:hypothetical protein